MRQGVLSAVTHASQCSGEALAYPSLKRDNGVAVADERFGVDCDGPDINRRSTFGLKVTLQGVDTVDWP
jgi:hypothetical protein